MEEEDPDRNGVQKGKAHHDQRGEALMTSKGGALGPSQGFTRWSRGGKVGSWESRWLGGKRKQGEL